MKKRQVKCSEIARRREHVGLRAVRSDASRGAAAEGNTEAFAEVHGEARGEKLRSAFKMRTGGSAEV